MTLALHNLGREILRCPAEGPRPIADPLGESEIGDLEVALAVQQKVFRLES